MDRGPPRAGPGGHRPPYDGPTSPREFYGGPPRDGRDFRRPSFSQDRGFASPVGRAGKLRGLE